MSEMDPRQAEMDQLLRRSLSAPVPRLSSNFEQALSRELRRRARPSKRVSRMLLASYGAVSAVVSVVVMRGQGLGWTTIAAMTLASLATFELARRFPGAKTSVK